MKMEKKQIHTLPVVLRRKCLMTVGPVAVELGIPLPSGGASVNYFL
jgi:hypothetical protein